MDSPAEMPLLCRLGRHRPGGAARWNHGYYFARCSRCGSDLVRTAYGKWQAPRGYRVVWQAEPPANAAPPALIREATPEPAPGPAPAAATASRELPIQEVLRHVQNRDLSEPPPAPRSRTLPATKIPDFMGEGTNANGWENRPRRYLKRAPAAAAPEAVPADAPEPGLFGRLGLAAPAAGSRRGLLAVVAASAVMLLLVVLILWAGGKQSEPVAFNESPEGGAPAGQPAFVTASMVNCRSAPAREAESVEILMRGDPVRLLARDGDWVSLVDRDGQCWALVRFVSAERPIQGRAS